MRKKAITIFCPCCSQEVKLRFYSAHRNSVPHLRALVKSYKLSRFQLFQNIELFALDKLEKKKGD